MVLGNGMTSPFLQIVQQVWCTGRRQRGQSLVFVACFCSMMTASWPTLAREVGVADSNEVKVGRKTLRLLQSSDDKCVLEDTTSKKSVALLISAPCSFARRGSRSVIQQHAYRGVGTVVFVFGKPETANYFASRAKVADEDRCSAQAQAIVIRKDGGVEATPVLENGIFCPKFGLDEKDFRAAAFPSK
jgi:hypothetical protein